MLSISSPRVGSSASVVWLGRLRDLRVGADEHVSEFDQAAPDRRLHANHGAGKSKAVPGRQEFVDQAKLGRFLWYWRLMEAFEKESDRNLESVCDLLQSARTDAVGPFFVFLNLLERQLTRVAEFCLGHAEQQ